MVSNKKRLYIALYPSGVVGNEERRYHWAFLIGPKQEKDDVVRGLRSHVKNTSKNHWVYEEHELGNVRMTNNLLARVTIAKITDEERLLRLLRDNPIVQGDDNWRCRTWIRQALEAMEQDGKCVGTSVLDWTEIERTAREYVASKTSAGRYGVGQDMSKPRPTYDMLEGKETVP